MKKRKLYYLLALLPVVYLLLLIFLYLAEAGQPDSRIQTFGDVLWYSIVTLSTVGYGDLTPVTSIGRIISTIFLVLSTGIMVTIVGATFSFLTGEAFPLFRLRRQKFRNWYYFADYGMESVTMAQNIYQDDPESVIIFGEKPGEQDETVDFPCYYLQTPLGLIVSCKEDKGKPVNVFFMRENDIGSNSRALNIDRLPVNVYARTSNGQDALSSSINCFHSYECCARQYWRSHPLLLRERQIVMIGFGNYGQNLLERAILTNIIAADQQITYHIYGDSRSFLAMHNHLDCMFNVVEDPIIDGSPVPAQANLRSGRDTLVFHQTPWESAHEILRQADRIILCMDDEPAGWDAYWNLQRYYHTHGSIDLRSSREMPGIRIFGSNNDIYTPGQILRRHLNQSAIAMNDIYRKAHQGNALGWDDLSDFMRQSKIAAADHVLMKIRILLQDDTITEVTPELLSDAADRYRADIWDEKKLDAYRRIEHARWCRFYAFHNWEYGEVSDLDHQRLPMLRPYEELTDTETSHHDHAWRLLKELEEYN